MSRQSREGKQRWQARRGTFAQKLTDQITAEATERMRMWSDCERIPWWIRMKARLRGRRIDRPGSTEA